ncbi:uncharacterized protein K460DRAFT_52362 [Cucurbitaria berberidis CBS 394.84]|uniref:Uncharacterized protein n=1 Tax=Cucurbitaria berberidis CBS 394.84 TaxID=1168544 RepID=A0A9P4LA47_9PLEO|nr:uncharacterized protein K460DRAFT_52362 [Cucurbitaria berberidis CBS 394.84]KAF1847043.1 hypothetical protein K460DRAFT_52362 [Cucurbitaria berberidis CBS 394.84]
MDWVQSYKACPQKVGFLDLPRELRDYVYGYASRVQGAILLYSPNPYAMIPYSKAMQVRHKGEGPVEPQPLGTVIPIALLTACRQLHVEGSAILYGSNAFRLWFLSDIEIRLSYRQLVKHIIFTTEVDYHIFSHNLDEVSYWWKRRFWPNLIKNSTSAFERFPGLETLTFPIKPPRHGESWRPAFFAVANKTRHQRVTLAANWMKSRCPLENERLRECLQLELVPFTSRSKDEPDEEEEEEEEEEEWDCTEFVEAFELMKTLR